ncbi:hypothetical protein acsn021_06130 [Anaerocolumna cellulosilytica]|uniref:Uncharacterized protein n=1 Tax=Anaerocolumna cellulosilytica TaxID=433286 RepID=A0A6S6QR15_9FIRM|nr:hypothetical protein [Anaerocolumna cellulosilytica]MBB5197744.1 hypothetical protein [Anaerocolumna cellulosilytica]BCJ93044.1 hypothetical protein acsn021_06130 [Anaerocolumna cellulosilytica]
MTEREKELKKNIVEYTAEYLGQQKKEIEKVFEIHTEEIFRELMKTFHELFQKAIQFQEMNEKGEINYITISFLNFGFLQNTIELKLSLFDNTFYMDAKEVTVYFKCNYFDKIIRNDMDNFKSYIERRMIQVKYHELYSYKKICMMKYKSVMENAMSAYVNYVVRLKSFEKLVKTKSFKIIFNEYMCQGTVLFESDEELIR